jgi:hypothetical protein
MTGAAPGRGDGGPLRVYLACTVRGDRGGVDAGRVVARGLAARGHRVLTEHLLRDDVEAMEGALADADVFLRDLAWLDACDVVVAEASASSFGVGFEVGYTLARAIETGRRVFLLFHEDRRAAISRLILGNCHPACVRVPYRTREDLDAFLDRYFSQV